MASVVLRKELARRHSQTRACQIELESLLDDQASLTCCYYASFDDWADALIHRGLIWLSHEKMSLESREPDAVWNSVNNWTPISFNDVASILGSQTSNLDAF